MAANKVNIQWTELGEHKFLKFSFPEKLTKEQASEAIIEWKRIFSEYKFVKITLIWDCVEMKDYDPMARVLWQKAMKDMSSQMDTVWLVSESKVIRTAAQIMSVFVKFELKPISSEDEISILSSSKTDLKPYMMFNISA